MDWQDFTLELPEEVNASKCDISPSNDLYLVLSNGTLAKLAVPAKGGGSVAPETVGGVERVTQVSAAADGKVWVVDADGLGSVVKWTDGDGWNTVPGIANATRVTGTSEGGAYIVNSSGQIIHHTAEENGIVPTDFGVKQISVGPDNRLWAISDIPQDGGSIVFYTDDNGANWNEVGDSGAVAIDAGLINSEVGVSA